MIKIKKGDVAEILPLTPMQEGLLFHYLKTPEGDQYCIQSCLEILGRIDIAIFKQAWQRVTDINGMLRTVFRWEEVKQPVQMVLKRHTPEVRFEGDRQENLEHLSENRDRQKNFDLRKVAFRVRLCEVAPDRYRMIISHHHILLDGWSLGIVLEEFFEAYSELARNRLSPPSVKAGFKLFIRWLQSLDSRWQENFWRSYLYGLNIRSRFPEMMFKTVSRRGTGREEIVFSRNLRYRLEKFVIERQATLPVLLYSAWGILLQKYLNQPDVVFGTTVSGRQAAVAGIEKMVGLLINTLPLRFNAGGDEKLSDVLTRIMKGLAQRQEYEDTPLSAINTWGGLTDGGELFDTLLVVENYPLADLASGGSGRPLSVDSISVVEATHYPLTLGITATDDIRLNFSYRRSRFDRQAVRRLAGHFRSLLEQFLSDPYRSLAAAEMLSREEKQQILVDFNDTWRGYPGHKRIHEFFEERARRHPHRIALEGTGLWNVKMRRFRQLSYGELNSRANRLARRLQRIIGNEGGIAVLRCDRSIDMIIGIVAILKSGCAYLPVDPAYPAERIRFMLADSAARAWLTAEDGILKVKRTDRDRYPTPKTGRRRTPDLAYIIYTSGSTGRPKGVMVAHRPVVNRLAWMQREYPLGERDTILQKTPVTFDVSVWELFWWAMAGARLSQLVPGGEKDPAVVAAAVARYGVTVLHFVPAMLTAMLEYVEEEGGGDQLKNLRRIFASGEKLTAVQVMTFNRLLYRNNGTSLINLYGPTEATVDVSYFDCSPGPAGEVIPIGKPIDNLRLLIKDNFGQLTPVGVAGELYITGAGVARGYLNQPELTARRFAPSPRNLFPESPTQYRTGDLARWLPDGNIDFLGRSDNQVKIRGHRIELGEIESRLQDHDRVGEAVVMVDKDAQGHHYLTAYIVPVLAGIIFITETELTDQLGEYVADHLPPYMIPTYFVILERLPRLASGKIDRRALPQSETQRFTDDFIPPGNETEIRLASIWADVLEQARERIGIKSDFFRSGGHSLKAMRLALLIHREFNVKIPVAQIFKFSNIRGQANYIRQAREVPFADIRPVPGTESGLYPLSSAQKRLFFLDRFEEIGTSYNMPGAVRIRGAIDIKRLEQSLESLTARHEALRTSFEYDGNIPGQRVHDRVDFKIEHFDSGAFGGWHPESAGKESLSLELALLFVRPFDISKAPLLRVGWLPLDTGRDYWLLFDMHHIISDGTSLGVLIRDFRQLYEGRQLPPLRIQYKDFAAWQNRLFTTGRVRDQESYWLERFAGEIPRLSLPGDFPRPPVFSFAGDQYCLELKDRDHRRLRLAGEAAGTTLFMNLLAAFNVLLYKYTGQEDFVVGTSVAGRRHADLQTVLGMFVNALALRNQPRGDKPYRDFLQEVKRASLEAFENQDLQFEELVDRLDPPRDPSRNPLFDVCLVLQNFDREKMEMAGAVVEYKPLFQRTSKFDLTLFVYEQGRTIRFIFEYYSAFFKSSTIERLAAHLVRIIRQVTETPALQLAAIDMLTPAEKKVLIRDFNRTAVHYPQRLTLHRWFESRVEKTPDAVALEERKYNRCLSYRELDSRADRVAGYLRRVEGVKPDTPVGIMMDRSEYLIIGIWGILKSGGAFVPLDPDVPEGRLKNIIVDAAVGSVLSGKRYIRVLNRLQWICPEFGAFLCLDSEDVYSEEEVEKSGLMDEKLWDYVAAGAADDITGGGWISSYTGLPFSRKEMDEYGDNILKKLAPLLQADMRVLEIGCASGISMYRLAPLVGVYYGIDLSGAMIEKNRRLAESGGFSNIALACLPAHRVDELGERDFDLVILNSVVQSFHGHNYLRRVIREVITLMGRSGYIFLGDVMDQQRKTALEAELSDFKARHGGDTLNTKTDWSTELFLQRGFFEDLKEEMPEIRRIEFSDKIFTVENELTKFRYDVLLKVEKGRRRRQPGPGEGEKKLKRQYDSRMLAGPVPLRPSAAVKPACLAYIMYTSGTTGRPKGVMIQHRSLINYVHWGIAVYSGGDRCHFPLYTSVTFDLTLTSIFLPLLSGGTVKIYGSGDGDDHFPLAQVLADNDVEAVKATPSHLEMLLRSEGVIPAYSRVRQWIVGGEALETELARRLYEGFSRNISIYNEYGPTEATVGCMIHLYDPGREREGTVPIGRPAANVGIYLLDEGGHPVPFNALGEIFIGGDGLTRGYLNQPELTADKFMKIDALILPSESRVLYRSGDLACRPGEEDIEFRGRRDEQVKVRGYRIETQDIRRHLLDLAGVKEAAVVLRTDRQGDGYLSAFVTVEGELSVNKIREHLACRLPAYMIPTSVVKLPRLPLDRSGKLAVGRLPDPLDSMTVGGAAGVTPPGDEIEKKLADIWADVLGLESRQVGIDTDFFDMGGHSLRATVVLAGIHRELSVRLPLAEMFKNPTVRRLARLIRRSRRDDYSVMVPHERREYYPLSSAQKRLFFLNSLEETGASYNMPAVFRVEGYLDQDRLGEATQILIRRHETLRTSFIMIRDEPVQRVHPQVEFSIEYNAAGQSVRWYSQYGEDDTRLPSAALGFFRPFDLSAPPLLRLGLVETGPAVGLFLFDMHHIIADGTSVEVLTGEFIRAYVGEKLSPLRLQYRDFALWQIDLQNSGKIRDQEQYWLRLYGGGRDIPRLNLPTDFQRPALFSFEGDILEFELDPQSTAGFKKLARQANATLAMTLNAAFIVLLHKYSGQDDLVAGCGIMGRRRTDLMPLIGMFVNALALRHHLHPEMSFSEFLGEVATQSVKAMENQDVQFESLVDLLHLERDPSRNPLFDVSLVVQNFERSVRTLSDLDLKFDHYPFKNKTCKFDLTLFAAERDDRLDISLEYYTALFRPETMVRLCRHFLNIIRQTVCTPGILLREIDMLSPAERHQLLIDFNRTSVPYPADRTIHQLFEEQSRKRPHQVVAATMAEEADGSAPNVRHLTYRGLAEAADRLAAYLRAQGHGRSGEAVALLMEGGEDLAVAILGVLKAGALYVPLAPSLPEARLKSILDDTGIETVISLGRHVRLLNRLQWQCPSFRTFLCLDSRDVHAKAERGGEGLMDRKLWDYVAETGRDDITAGGWLSSYTGRPFSREEMDEYGENILRKLAPLLHRQMRVLEIGCASGITMYRIAPLVGIYYGTDLSAVTIEKNERRVSAEGIENIVLRRLAAHEIDEIDGPPFDLVIINSVIQAFPGHNYLRQVIGKAVGLLGDPGYLFIGDIMDQEMKEALYRDLLDFKRKNRDHTIQTKLDLSAELFVSRQFFRDLQVDMPRIRELLFSDKIHTIENELTRFRYDVLIRIDNDRRINEVNRSKCKCQHDAVDLEQYGQTPVPGGIAPHQPAYMIYTSGTTAVPRGILVEHRSLVNYISWRIGSYRFSDADITLQLLSPSFDGFTANFYPPLLTGGRLVLLETADKMDLNYISAVLRRERITNSSMIPAMFQALLTGLPPGTLADLRFIVLAGDKAAPELLALSRKMYPRLSLQNEYGPTEATVAATAFSGMTEDTCSIIGEPIANQQVYILDNHRKLQPIGIPGELYIAGRGLSRGYLNQPELTAAQFIHFPLESSSAEIPAGMATYSPVSPIRDMKSQFYRTGDLCRWRPEGIIEFMGRIDHQVKVRGYRIELTEIENCLRRHDGVQEAVAAVRQHEDGEKFLVAYFVSSGSMTDSDLQLREYLSCFIPPYMIPLQFIELERLPRTAAGKVDRRALPLPGSTRGDGECTAPAGDVEHRLIGIWAAVLGISAGNIGVKDDFFTLGGHSLKATSLAARIHRKLNVKVPLAEIFKNSTIRGLARYIEGCATDKYAAVRPVEKREYYRASPAQQRFYLLQQMRPESIAFNMPGLIILEKRETTVERGKIEAALTALIRRHHSLRTAFRLMGESLVQKIDDAVDFELEYYELTASAPKEAKGGNDLRPLQEIVDGFVRPFDLGRAPLLRAALIRVPPSQELTHPDPSGHPSQEGTYLLMFDVHHIVSDGTSMNILNRDFNLLVSSRELPTLSLQYRDFCRWQYKLLKSGQLKEAESFWLAQLDGEIPLLSLATDFPRLEAADQAGDAVSSCLGESLCVDLQALRQQTGTTLYMVLLAALNALLFRYTGQTDIIVATPVAGRHHADLQPVIGLLLGSVVMRSFPEGVKSFTAFLQEVKTSSLRAFENQAYPLEALLKKIDYRESSGRNPLSDVALMVQNIEEENNFRSALLEYPVQLPRTSRMDLTLSAREGDGDIEILWEYRRDLFRRQTVERLAGHFIHILKEVTREPEISLANINLVSEDERRQLLGSPSRLFPLSHAQKRIYYTQRRYPDTTVAVLGCLVCYPRALNMELLAEAINRVIQRHEALRLRLVEFDFEQEPRQYATPFEERTIDLVDLDIQGRNLLAFCDETMARPFSRQRGDLFYAVRLKLDDRRTGYFVKAHHLVADGWTLSMLAEQIHRIYEDLRASKPPADRGSPSYLDYLDAERDYLKSPQARQDRDFWHRSLLPLPNEVRLSYRQADDTDIRAGDSEFLLPVEALDNLRCFCREPSTTTTVYQVLLAVLSIYIFRVSGLNDFVIGSAHHNRSSSSQRRMAGMFVSTVPLRIEVADHLDFSSLLRLGKETIRCSMKHHFRYPFDLLALQLAEKSGRSCDYLLNINLIGQKKIGDRGFSRDAHFSPYEESHLTIHIFDEPALDRLEWQWRYRLALFSPAEIDRIQRGLINILRDALSNPKKRISDLEILSAEEKYRLIEDLSGPAVDYPGDRTLQQIFSNSAEKNPHRIALLAPCGRSSDFRESREIQLSYRELANRTLQLARFLVEKGAGLDVIVGLLARPGLEMVVAVLGILHAGAAYLPLDPDYPQERIRYILADCDSRLVLNADAAEQTVEGYSGCISMIPVFLEETDVRLSLGRGQANSGGLAYVIYTSGSTGRPKGVPVSHGNVTAYLKAFDHEFPLVTGDTVIQQASFAFDAFVEEMYPVLSKGGRLAVAGRGAVRDTERLVRFILKHRVTVISCSPLLLNELNRLKQDLGIRLYISGGDVLRPEHVDCLVGTGEVYNTYGPTEATVCTTYYRCPADMADDVPIGSPIANNRICILDRNRKWLPPGVAGELCIAGPGVTGGYLNNPELTAKKFIKVPSNSPLERGGPKGRGMLDTQILYRTGDLCRLLPDGHIGFLGRIDRQVKIRGYRIELAEIENRLRRYGEILDVAVVDRLDETGEKYLAAYLVSRSCRPFSPEILREYLGRVLPGYMVPRYFINMEHLPLTPGGKLDRQQLPLPAITSAAVPPRDELEAGLADLFAEVLHLDRQSVGLDADFFDLGGHSLKAARLASHILKNFRVTLQLAEIFKTPTIRKLAAMIRSAAGDRFFSIPAAEKREYYPLSSVQRRLYSLYRVNPGNVSYNMPLIFAVEGRFDLQRLEAAFSDLIRRHESLRTSFRLVGDEPVQKVDGEVVFKIEYGDSGSYPPTCSINGIIKDFIRPFELSRPPLMRVGLGCKDFDTYLMVDMHHIVSDGISHGVLTRDFVALYRGNDLPDLKIHYKDYCLWRHSPRVDQSTARGIPAQEAYWLERFKGELPLLELPVDFPRPPVQGFEGDSLHFCLGSKQTAVLFEMSGREGVTPFMILLGIYTILLSKLSGQEDIIVGTSVAVRRHADLEGVIGMFVNAVVLRNFPAAEKRFRDFLIEVKEITIAAFDNQDYPFEHLVEKIISKRIPGRNPVFDVMFVLNNEDTPITEIPGLKLKYYDYERRSAQMDLKLRAMEAAGDFYFTFEYDTQLFRRETVAMLARNFTEIATTVLENNYLFIKDIQISHGLLSTRKDTSSMEFGF